MQNHQEHRRKRLAEYKNAIENEVLLPNHPNMMRQISHYDQLCMVDKELSKLENELYELTGEIT